mgnify:CR=1 FL=1
METFDDRGLIIALLRLGIGGITLLGGVWLAFGIGLRRKDAGYVGLVLLSIGLILLLAPIPW